MGASSDASNSNKDAEPSGHEKLPYFSNPNSSMPVSSKPASAKKEAKLDGIGSIEINRLNDSESDQGVTKFDEQRK